MIIGVGIDLVDLEHFGKKLSPELIAEVFTAAEAEYCASRSRPLQHYAVRFAAREAVMKALGSGLAQGLRFSEIEIQRCPDGSIEVGLHGAAARRAAELGVTGWRLSLTHTTKSAAAVALALGERN